MFCHNCGADAGSAKFCPECGTRILTPDASADRGTGTLTLRKYNSARTRGIVADVYIDGQFHTVISNSETTTVTLPAGEHELLIHADGCVDALQRVQIDALGNRLCIFSVDDAGFISIVQEGSVPRSAGYTQFSGHGSGASGAAACQSTEPAWAEPAVEEQPVTRSAFAAQENTKYCRHCGSLIHEESVVCPNCGRQVEELRREEPKVIERHTTVITNGKEKDKWVAFFLCLFLGTLGIHKFYEGKVGMGILYIFTVGLFGIGVLIDLIRIVMKPNPYYV